MKISRSLTPLAAIMVILTGSLAPARADNPQYPPQLGKDQAELEQVIVTATRIDRRREAVARTLSVLDRDWIESIQGQSVGDILAYLPNVTVAGGPRAGSQTVNIRGLGGNKLLQTVDGARLSFESGHRPSYYLDPELLKGVEALNGPASSLWGSGALGGVIAQRTLEAHDLAGERKVGGFLRTGFNDNSHQSTTTVAVAGQGNRADLLLSGYYRNSDDLELGNARVLIGSASRNTGMLTKLNWQPVQDHEIQVNLRTSSAAGTVPTNGTAATNETSNFLIDRTTRSSNASLRWSFEPVSVWVDSQALVYWNRVDVAEARITDGRADATRLNEFGINLMNLSLIGNTTWQYGADIYREKFDAVRSGANRPTPPIAISDVWSLYALGSIPVADNWRLEAGIRYDHFTTGADNLGSIRSDSDVTTSLALSWEPAEWARLAVRYDEAFRAPTSEELYTSGTHFCIGPGLCNGFVPNPELAPEQAANTEILAEFRLNSLVGADSLVLSASVFRNRVDDFIEQIVTGPSFFPLPSAGTTTWVNVSAATISGFEASARYQRHGLGVQFAYGQTRGEDKATGADLTNIPADTFTADVNYALADAMFVTGLRLTVASEQARTSYPENTGGETFDGYTRVDLYANWSPQLLSGVRFDLNVNNVTDRFYRRAWDQLPESGREVILSARYSF